MEIVQVTNKFLPSVGGIENQVYNISKRLAAKGHNVSVYTSDEIGPTNQKARIRNQIIDGIRIFRFPVLHCGFSSGKALIPRLLLSLLNNNAQVVHAHSAFSLSSTVASFPAKFSSTRFVFTPLHPPLPPATHHKPSDKAMIRLYNSTVLRMALRISDKIIATTHHEMKEYEKLGVPPGKIAVITPAVDWKGFSRISDGEKFRRTYCPKENVVLSVARIDKAKGLETLVQAAAIVLDEIPDVDFVIVGEDWGYRRKLEGLCKSMKVANNIIFTGYLSDQDLLEAYFSANVVVLPSQREGFGIALLEGAACGKPLVATRWTGLSELLRYSEVGMVFDYGDAKHLAKCLIELISDSSKSRLMGTRGRELVRNKFTYEVKADETERVYESLCES